jgi:DNA-binding NarL/FixJ family response regulator
METSDLTYAERLILRMLARDLTRCDIGSELGLSVKTVRTHVRSIYRKLRVSSRVEAMNVARTGTSPADPGRSANRTRPKPSIGQEPG